MTVRLCEGVKHANVEKSPLMSTAPETICRHIQPSAISHNSQTILGDYAEYIIRCVRVGVKARSCSLACCVTLHGQGHLFAACQLETRGGAYVRTYATRGQARLFLFRKMNPSDSTQFWKSIKFLNKRVTQEGLPSHDGKQCSNDLDKANCFIDFFNGCFKRRPANPFQLYKLTVT